MDSRTGVGFWLNVGILYMTIIGMGMHISEKSSQIDFKQFSNMTITNIKPLWSINIEHGNAIKTLVHIYQQMNATTSPTQPFHLTPTSVVPFLPKSV